MKMILVERCAECPKCKRYDEENNGGSYCFICAETHEIITEPDEIPPRGCPLDEARPKPEWVKFFERYAMPNTLVLNSDLQEINIFEKPHKKRGRPRKK